eukprot:s2908_g7.t1
MERMTQEPPSVRLVEGDVHWTEELAPRLEPNEAAAVICTKNHGPGNEVTRQCVKCASDYRIHFCRSSEISSAIRTVEVEKEHIAIVHRKTGGTHDVRAGAEIEAQISHETWRCFSSKMVMSKEMQADGSVLCRILFQGGFPNGGECYADVHAPWGQCYTDIPPGGSLFLEIPSH